MLVVGLASPESYHDIADEESVYDDTDDEIEGKTYPTKLPTQLETQCVPFLS